MDERSSQCEEWMKFLGNFGPTVDRRHVKGYMIDADDGEGGKVYLNSSDLRQIAAACNEMADWLDRRAVSATGNTK